MFVARTGIKRPVIEPVRQVINLLHEGQISLAAVHATNNNFGESQIDAVSLFVSPIVHSAFIQLVGDINGWINV